MEMIFVKCSRAAIITRRIAKGHRDQAKYFRTFSDPEALKIAEGLEATAQEEEKLAAELESKPENSMASVLRQDMQPEDFVDVIQ